MSVQHKKQFDPQRQQWYGTLNGKRVTGFYDNDEKQELEKELQKLDLIIQNKHTSTPSFKDYFETVVRTGHPKDQVEYAKDYLEYRKRISY